jgi:glycosyltransferase involved in cell wall biosynthesis
MSNIESNFDNNKVVSIVMPCFNKEDFVYDSIQSVINQTYTNWELIIIDDASSDKSYFIINQFIELNNNIKVIQNKIKQGANTSRNIGLSIAKGDFIIFFDADDLLDINCLEFRIMKIQNSNLDFAVFSMRIFYNNLYDDDRTWIPKSKNYLNSFLMHDLPWQTMQPIWRKEFVIKIKGFDECFFRLQDVEFHTRALSFYPNFEVFSKIIDCHYRANDTIEKYKLFELRELTVISALNYFNKFFFHPEFISKINFLNGTIYQIYIRIIKDYKNKNLSKYLFLKLEKQLLNNEMKNILGYKFCLIIKFSKFYNLYLPRIYGLNRFFKIILTKTI